MATQREKDLAAELLTLALNDGLEMTPQLCADISAQARTQAAQEREAARHEEAIRAERAFGYPVDRCTKCDGAKVLPHYAGISGGRCYQCQGKGWVRA